MENIEFKKLKDITRIRKENTKTYFTCLGVYAIPLCNILKDQGISYKYYPEDSIPNGAKQYVILGKEKMYYNIGCFESYANTDDLEKILEEIPFLPIDTIETDDEDDGGW